MSEDRAVCEQCKEPLVNPGPGWGWNCPNPNCHNRSTLTTKQVYDLREKQLATSENTNRPGDPRFFKILEEMRALHVKKAQDYSAGEDQLGNVRSSEQFGIPAWVGCMVRAHDKMIRIQNMARKGSLANESVEDSLIDLANYAVLGLILYREVKGG